MIGDLLLNMLYIAVSFVVSKLPDSGTLSTSVTNSITYFHTAFDYVNSFWAMDTLLQTLVIIFVVDQHVLLYKLLKWAYSKIPGVN